MENKKENEEKKVSIPESMFESLRKELAELKKKVENKDDDIMDIDVDDNNTVNLRKYENKIVIGYNKERGTWQEYDRERREDRLMIELIFLGKDDKSIKKSVDYINFLNDSSVIKVELEKIKSQKVVEEKGFIRIKEVVDYKTVRTKNRIMQKVISRNDIAVVKMPNGNIMEIDIDFVNL